MVLPILLAQYLFAPNLGDIDRAQKIDEALTMFCASNRQSVEKGEDEYFSSKKYEYLVDGEKYPSLEECISAAKDLYGVNEIVDILSDNQTVYDVYHFEDDALDCNSFEDIFPDEYSSEFSRLRYEVWLKNFVLEADNLKCQEQLRQVSMVTVEPGPNRTTEALYLTRNEKRGSIIPEGIVVSDEEFSDLRRMISEPKTYSKQRLEQIFCDTDRKKISFNDPLQDIYRNTEIYQFESFSEQAFNDMVTDGVRSALQARGVQRLSDLATNNMILDSAEIMAKKYEMIRVESNGHFDYSGGKLNPDSLYIHNGVAYNSRDLGNYLWGATMKCLNVPYTVAKVGAETNGFFNTISDNNIGNGAGSSGIILTGDSSRDQEVIKKGYETNIDCSSFH